MPRLLNFVSEKTSHRRLRYLKNACPAVLHLKKMNENYNILIDKLDAFIRKYYTNRLIRGILYSIALLGSFFLIIALLESAAWFSSPVRTVLFYGYLAAALFILGKFIINPLLKLNKAGKRISHDMAAQIIGEHFSEVKDSLLNTLQLHKLADSEAENYSLVIAGINQKAANLKPVPFLSAIDLSKNRKYLPLALPPVLIILALLLVSPTSITEPGKRLIRHAENFEKPLPFTFHIENENLKAIQQEDFELRILVAGEELPEHVYLVSEGSEFRMEKHSKLGYSFIFKKVRKNQTFHFLAGGYESPDYELVVLPRPTIVNFDLELNYPAYTGVKPETVSNSGDVVIPQGTQVTWKFFTRDTRKVSFRIGSENRELKSDNNNVFQTTERVMAPVDYSVSLQNEFMTGSDSMSFTINVIPDVYPVINVEEYRDTIYDNRLYFRGLIKDDYGFNKLEFRLARKTGFNSYSAETSVPVPFDRNNTQQTFYHFFDLSAAGLVPGDEVEYYFQVWDNDAVNGNKSSRSQKMSFRLPTLEEIEEMVKKNQENVKSELEKSLDEARAIQKEIEQLNLNLFDKKSLNYQEKKQIQDLIDRQKNLQKQVEQIREQHAKTNQKEQQYKEINESIAEKQQQLEKLFEQIMTDEMKQLFEELQKMMDDLDKNKLNEVMDKLQFNAEDLEKSLDRNLELFKQLEFDKKLTETIDKLKELADEQKKLSEETAASDKNDSDKLREDQQKISEKFDKIRENLKDLEKMNKELEEPNNFKNPEDRQQDIKKELEQSDQELKSGQMKKASGKQKSASDKMEELSNMLFDMQQAMEEEELAEDIDALRLILENLVRTSFEQEDLMNVLSKLKRNDPKYPNIIERQTSIKDNLLMIEDSLFALSKRQAAIGQFVNREIAAINDNVESAMEALHNRIVSTVLNKQQFVMTSVNNLALMLAESMNQMEQNMMMKSSGKSGKSCPMPGQGKPSMKSMRQMQEKLNQQMEAMKKSMQEGKDKQGKTRKSGMSEQLARMAAQQEALRRQLQEYRDELQKEGRLGDKGLNKMIQDMERTESDLVNKILNEQTMRRQQDILTRLLESEKADMQREQEEKRESNEGKDLPKPDPASFFDSIGLPGRETELLRTIPPSLKNYYRNKVNEYFISIPTQEK